MPQTTKQYVEEIFDWLVQTFPTPYPVELRWQKVISYGSLGKKVPKRVREKGIFGECWRDGKKIVIVLSKRRCRFSTVAEETLLHEFAHAVATRPYRQEKYREIDHDDEWALAYGRIYRAFLQKEGLDE